MRNLTAIALLAILCGCSSMTEKQKRGWQIATGVLVVGAIAAHKADNGSYSVTTSSPVGAPPGCFPQPDGSCR